MAKVLCFDWLLKQARDENSREWLKKIQGWREYILAHNEFIEDDESFTLYLGSYALKFHTSSAFSAIEVYQEIFKENAHFVAPGFSGEDAGTVLDIGANQGFYALRLKEVNPKCQIIAIEPNLYEFEVLSENLTVNGVENVFLEMKAVAPKIGTTTLEIIPQIGAIGGKKVKIPERPWVKDSFIKIIPVQTVTLDAIFEKYKIQKADIVKIDIEGSEYDVLRHTSILARINKLVVEYHNGKIRDNIIALLTANMFKLVLEDHQEGTYYGDLYFKNEHIH